jgi:hypothetical protein
MVAAMGSRIPEAVRAFDLSPKDDCSRTPHRFYGLVGWKSQAAHWELDPEDGERWQMKHAE